MNKLPKYLSIVMLMVGALFALPTHAFAAPKIYFDPISQTAVQNNEFTIQLKIDAESNQVIGSDVVVSYAGNDLDVTSVTSGNYFPSFQYADNGSGRLELHGYVTSMYQGKTGAGTLATLKFKSTKNSGSSALTITCSGNGNDTNMLANSGQNILTCSSTNQVAITYSGTGGTTHTPTPTTAIGATPTPTQTGSQNNTPTCTSFVASSTNLQGTPQAISFTCWGTDSGGTINAAEFTFGDGTKQVIEKNVGSTGSLSTTHTYTSLGTFGVSCRVRDNNSSYSSASNACKQTVVIRPKPTSIPTSASTPIVTTTTTVTTETTTPTPTVAIVSIVSVTPYPTLVLMPSPSLYPPEETAGMFSSRFWWIVGGALSLLLAFLLLRRRKPPKAPPAPPQMPPIVVQENTAIPPEPPPTV